MLIREFRIGDEPALWQVFYAAIHETAAADYSKEQVDAWAPPGRDPAAWAARVRPLAPLVAERDGIVLGYADVQADGYIDHFYVSPRVARQGVGTALMARIHERASAAGMAELYANVSITARPFFEHCGFRVEREQIVAARGVTFTNYRMRKSLGSGGAAS
ncbi:MAG: GNAT family N-acetyltransferase [Phycisphaerae bacterium]